ncbi:hypothetical protein D3C79_806790 [compost metagenome]
MLTVAQVHQFQLERLQGKRQFVHRQRQQMRKLLGQLPRQHHTHVGGCGQMGGLQVVGRGIGDLPGQALLGQPLVDHAPGLAAVHPDVPQAQECVEVQCLAWRQVRVLLAQRDLQGFTAPWVAGEARWHLVEAAQYQVEVAPVQRLGRQVGGQVHHVDAQVGCQ